MSDLGWKKKPKGLSPGKMDRLFVTAWLALGACSWVIFAGGVRTIAEKRVLMYQSGSGALTERLQRYVYYVDKGVTLASVIEPGQPDMDVAVYLAKGTKVKVLGAEKFKITVDGLSGALGGGGAGPAGTVTVHERIVNSYDIEAAFVEIRDGKEKGKRGWIVNHMLWLTCNGKKVDEVKVSDRLCLHAASGEAFKIWEVEMKNGRVLRSEVLEDKGDAVSIQTELGRVTVQKSRIREIRQVDE